jgi:hypothetical protein
VLYPSKGPLSNSGINQPAAINISTKASTSIEGNNEDDSMTAK